MTKRAVLMLVTVLATGCGQQRPLDTVGAIVTAPITAPIMFLGARLNDRQAFLERARKNYRPLPPVDAQSREKAQITLEQALNHGAVDEGLYWRNDSDESGYAAGGVTVLLIDESDGKRICREVLIETAIARQPTDQRVRTYCWNGSGWVAGTREDPSSS